jgi:hypothetical protein
VPGGEVHAGTVDGTIGAIIIIDTR